MEYLTLGMTVLNAVLVLATMGVAMQAQLAASRAEPFVCPNCHEPLWDSSGAKFQWFAGQDYVSCPKCGITQKAKGRLPVWVRLTKFTDYCRDPACGTGDREECFAEVGQPCPNRK